MTRGDRDPARIAFDADLVPRLEALRARLAGARGREAGAGSSRASGAGDEFLGHRPYRAGEELRHLDWALLARSERAFVRVFRREVGQRCTLLLDASASMGLGAPGKLQLAAEVVTALAFTGLAQGARSRLLVARGGEVQAAAMARPADLGPWLRALDGLAAGGATGPGALLEAADATRPARLVVVGDLLDLFPARVAALARPGRRVDLVRVLAPHELAPPDDLPPELRWVDPETGARTAVALDRTLRLRYEQALARHLERWDRLARRGRLTHTVWSSAAAFEDVVLGVSG